jgi:hypothetical protein
MTKILWVSRHPALPAQIRELKKRFGKETVIVADSNPFSSAEDIVQRLKGFDEMVVVAPLSVISRLCELGVRPLWAEMKVVSGEFNPDSDVILPGQPPRHMRFQQFKRIKKVALEFDEDGK